MPPDLLWFLFSTVCLHVLRLSFSNYSLLSVSCCMLSILSRQCMGHNAVIIWKKIYRPIKHMLQKSITLVQFYASSLENVWASFEACHFSIMK